MPIYPVQSQTFTVVGNGAVAGSVSIQLESFKDILGNNLTMASFGDSGFGTIEPNTTNEDSISFTGITQNPDGTATLTGVASRLFITPFTAGSGLRASHAGSVPFIISNTSAFYTTYPNKSNQESITQNWTVPDPVGATDIANKQYVLSVVNGGPVSFASVILPGNAGETVAAGNVLYLNGADNEWYKADADNDYSVETTFGVAQGSGTNGNTITDGVLIYGVDDNQSGLTTGQPYYISTSAGGIVTPSPSKSYFVGNAISATSVVVEFGKNVVTDGEKDALPGSQGLPATGNKYVTQDNTSASATLQSQSTFSATFNVGEASTTGNQNRLAQKFTATRTKIRGVFLRKKADTATFTGTVTVSLQADTAGSPSGSALATVTLTNAQYVSITTDSEIPAMFSSQYNSLVAGTDYWIVIETSTADTLNHPNLGGRSAGGGTNTLKYFNATDSWVSFPLSDLYYRTIEGGASQAAVTGTDGRISRDLQSNTQLYQTSGTAVTSGTGKTLVGSVLIPAFTVGTNWSMRMQYQVNHANGSGGSNRTTTLDIEYGATSLYSFVTVNDSIATHNILATPVFSTTASYNANRVTGMNVYDAVVSILDSAKTVDTTIDQTLSFYVTVSGASTTSTVRLISVELIRT